MPRTMADEPMDSEEEETPPESESEEDPGVKAFRVLRHAIADGDDEAGAEALRHCMTIYGPEESDSPISKDRPNLAAILIGKKKKGY